MANQKVLLHRKNSAGTGWDDLYPEVDPVWKRTIEEAVLTGGSGGEGAFSAFDVVVRDQAAFELLYNSPTWHGAKSVALIGSFTRSDGLGIKIPSTVARIEGFNSATITINDFAYTASNIAGLYYTALNPNPEERCITGLKVICNTTRYPTSFAAFRNCAYLTNCVASCRADIVAYGAAGAVAFVGGFRDCVGLTNCSATCVVINKSTSFEGAHEVYSEGFTNCSRLLNCTARATAHCTQDVFPPRSTGYGFYKCKQLLNCGGSGSGLVVGPSGSTAVGYGFFDCSYSSGCIGDDTTSTTALWGGNILKRDDDSCQLE